MLLIARSSPFTALLHRLASSRPCIRAIHRTPVRMVEGHQCHRVAAAHRKALLGHAFAASSPNKRFVEGAAAVNGKPLTRIEVHGKNLFYFFGADEAAPVVVHIHFGMSGAFKTASLPGPEPTDTTRLRLVNEELGVVALLSAMTVQHGDLEFYEQKAAKLGQDPLREDADPEEAWRRVSASKKPIGLLLMDQGVVAGVGNIYRAEILFKAGVHPEQPGCTLGRQVFDEVWRHSVLLLQRGFQTGSILTVDPQEASVLGKPWTRRYIYNHSSCGRCGSAIRNWDMAGRTAYACETCQPLPGGAQLAAGRAKALRGAKQAQVFVSHCAPDDPADLPLSTLKLPALRAKLAVLGLPRSGKKAELMARLEDALASGATAGAAGAAAAGGDGDGTPAGDVLEDAVGPARGTADAAVPTPSPRLRRGRAARGTRLAAAAPGEGTAAAAGVEAAAEEAAVFPEKYEWSQQAQQAEQAAAGGGSAAAPQAAGAKRRRGGSAASGSAAQQEGGAVGSEAGAAGSLDDAAPSAAQREPVVPGTKGLGPVASAEEAAAEKARAGEGRNVEHVALHTDGTQAAAGAGGRGRGGLSGKRTRRS